MKPGEEAAHPNTQTLKGFNNYSGDRGNDIIQPLRGCCFRRPPKPRISCGVIQITSLRDLALFIKLWITIGNYNNAENESVTIVVH